MKNRGSNGTSLKRINAWRNNEWENSEGKRGSNWATVFLKCAIFCVKHRSTWGNNKNVNYTAALYLREHKIEVSIFNKPQRCCERVLLTANQTDIVGYTHGLFPLSVCTILSPGFARRCTRFAFHLPPSHPLPTLAYNRCFNMHVCPEQWSSGNCVQRTTMEEKKETDGAIEKQWSPVR